MLKQPSKEELEQLYIEQKKSVSKIAQLYNCSEHKVNYWIYKYKIPKRTISASMYLFHNPNGDPFSFVAPKTIEEAQLFGLGLGLYWGEGTKRNKNSVRLGNTDSKLIKKFIEFLEKFFNIDKIKLRYALQIFSDMSPGTALDFWKKELGVSGENFQKVIITPSRNTGTYKNKIKHGVLTVYFCNVKLRNILCETIENIV